MQIDNFVLGDFETNCYLLRSDPEAKECLIIDPGFSAEPLLEFLKKESLQPTRIILTHGHCDHIEGIKLLLENFNGISISIGKDDAEMLTSCRHNLSLLMGAPFKLKPPDELLEDGDLIELDNIKLEVLATPGHSPGGVSFFCRDDAVVFAGDCLFAGSIGRTDFPNASSKTLLDSIRQKLLTLPDQTRVYSGHGPETSIEIEKRTNPFLR